MVFIEIPEEKTWKIPILKQLISVKNFDFEIDSFSQVELDDLIYFICTT